MKEVHMLIAVIAIGAIFCAGVLWELDFSHLWHIKVTIPRIAARESAASITNTNN
jgi:hypothetical protein